MPAKEKPKRKVVRRSEEEIQEILAKVAAMQAEGTSVVKALVELKVSPKSYYKWYARFGRGASSSKPLKSVTKEVRTRNSRTGRKDEEIRRLLEKIGQLHAGGMTLRDAQRQLGVSSSSFAYWRKKYGVSGSKTRGKTVGGGTVKDASDMASGSHLAVIEELRKNRLERQKLAEVEKRIAELDDQFQALRKKLG